MSDLPWVEKYRPRLLSDVVGNFETIERLKVIAKGGNMPHLMISGPPGCGKTTSIWCLANEMLGEYKKDAVLELNASDDRSVTIVRTDIKQFSRKQVTLPPAKHKIIILDEADSMTEGAQQALRRVMEMYSDTTRFALACNFSNKIIEPIQSRCAVLRYTKLSEKEILERLIVICNEEGLKYVPDGLEAIIFASDGDLRQAINNLQSTASGFKIINSENVFKFCDRPHPDSVKGIIQSCLEQDIDGAIKVVRDLYRSGFGSLDIVTVMFKVVKVYDMCDFKKLEFIKHIGYSHMEMISNCQSLVQLSGLVANLCSVSLET